MFINCLPACLPCFWMCCSLNLQCLFLGLTKQAVDSLSLLSELPKENTSPVRYWTKMSSKQIHPGFCLLPAVWFCSLRSFLVGTMLIRKLKTHTPNRKRKLKTTQCPICLLLCDCRDLPVLFFHLIILTACAKASDQSLVLILQPGTTPAEDGYFRRGHCAAVINVTLNLVNLLFLYMSVLHICARGEFSAFRGQKRESIALGEVVSCHVDAGDQRRPGPPEEQPGLRPSSHGSSFWFTLSSWKVVMMRLFILCRKDFCLYSYIFRLYIPARQW